MFTSLVRINGVRAWNIWAFGFADDAFRVLFENLCFAILDQILIDPFCVLHHICPFQKLIVRVDLSSTSFKKIWIFDV